MSIFTTKVSFSEISLTSSIIACTCMATFYVLSLYLWSKQNRFNRNEPSTIQRRFISVTLTCILSFTALFTIAKKHHNTGHPLHNWIGLNLTSGFFPACLSSILATCILFSGPILQYMVCEYLYRLRFKVYEPDNPEAKQNWLSGSLKYLREHLSDLCFWRNYVVSPFTEEFVFRGCMLPLLATHLSHSQAILMAPLFFGLAHLHHIIEGYFVHGQELKYLLMQHLFQFSYTYIFGAYSSYLFLRTGNLFACFVSHSICNWMGFPNIRQLLNDFKPVAKYWIVSVYVMGLVGFFVLVPSLTEPELFDNRTYVW